MMYKSTLPIEHSIFVTDDHGPSGLETWGWGVGIGFVLCWIADVKEGNVHNMEVWWGSGGGLGWCLGLRGKGFGEKGWRGTGSRRDRLEGLSAE